MEGRTVRVAHLIHGMVLGGLEQMVLSLAGGAREHGVEPLIVSFGPEGPIQSLAERRALPFHWLGDVPGLSWSMLRAAGQQLADFEADVVHAHDLGPWLNAALLRAWRPTTPVVATFHQLKRPVGTHRVMATVAALSSRALVACGTEVRNDLSTWAPPGTRIVTIGNGVAIPGSLDPTARATARATLGLPDGVVAMGYLGRMHEEKGPDRVLEAFLSRFRGDPSVRLVLIGDGPLLPALRERAAGEANVHLPGEVTDGAQALLQGLDVYIQGSRREGRSLSMLEAMGAGLPTVAHDLPAISEIHSQETALLVPLGDQVALGNALVTLARDGARRERMGRAARLAARAYSSEHMVAQYVALYRGPGALA